MSHDSDSTHDNPSMHAQILRLDETIREVYIRKTYLGCADMVVYYDIGSSVVLTLDEKDADKYMNLIYQELLMVSNANNTETNKN